MKKIPTLSDHDPDIIRHVAWLIIVAGLGFLALWLILMDF